MERRKTGKKISGSIPEKDVQVTENAAYDRQKREQEHEKDLERIRNFCLLDDDFMSKCFENHKVCTELVLHIVLNNDELSVLDIKTQYSIKNLQGRSVRLDIYAADRAGREYNIEIQRTDHGAGAKRARYNSSVLDTNFLKAGEDFTKLPETYVIFITEHDVLGDGWPIYHIDRKIDETGKLFGDESHIIYVNAECKDETPLGKLMHDFACINPQDMKYKVLADRTKYFKEEKEGISVMCKAMEEMRDEVKTEERRNLAGNLLTMGKLSIVEIALASGLTLEEVKKLEAGENG